MALGKSGLLRDRSARPAPGPQPSRAGPGLGVYSLHPSGLFLLAGGFTVDERTSRFASSVIGTSTMNVYLVREPERALLIDTGWTVHRREILEALERLVPDTTSLSILHTRLGEYDSVCNTTAIVNSRRIHTLYGNQISGEWTDYDAMLKGRQPASQRLAQEAVISLSESRALEVFLAELRLLPTFWAYDSRTRTMFTSDMFSYVVESPGREPPFVTSSDSVDERVVADHLLEGRYWWLPHVDPRPLQEALLSRFQRFDVHTIAPGYGALIRGPAAVRRHVAILAQVIGRVGGTAR